MQEENLSDDEKNQFEKKLLLLYLIDNQRLIALEYFKKRIPAQLKDKIKKYVEQNQKSIKKGYEVIANYFYDKNSNEYIVKCGIYEDEITLMELSLSVVSRDEAKLICKNWREKVNILYADILNKVLGEN